MGWNSFHRWWDHPLPGGLPSAGGALSERPRNPSISAFQGFWSYVFEYCVGNGAIPAWARKDSRVTPAGALDATLPGSCSGAGPTVGIGKGSTGAGAAVSSVSLPNSSKSSSCCVNDWAPKTGLGKPLVGTLTAGCRAGGRTLFIPASLKVPVGPPTKAPLLASGSVASTPWAKFRPINGPVRADGSPTGGGPKTSSGAAGARDAHCK